jgi:Hemerythrin HHE cation binding domain
MTTDLIWIVPSHRMDAATARRSILLQHQRIRVLLAAAREVAERALDQEAQSPDDVASAIGAIHTTLEVHLRFEEKVLVDIFNDDLPLGPVRAARLLDEHARQRATLTGLHEEAKTGPLVPMLAAKLAFLATWLLDDMAEEERSLLTTDVVRDDGIAVDQSDG